MASDRLIDLLLILKLRNVAESSTFVIFASTSEIHNRIDMYTQLVGFLFVVEEKWGSVLSLEW